MVGAPPRRVRGPPDALRLQGRRPRAFDDEFAGGSGAHVAGFAIEQADAEIVLDRLDAPAERGLAQMHRLRSMSSPNAMV